MKTKNYLQKRVENVEWNHYVNNDKYLKNQMFSYIRHMS